MIGRFCCPRLLERRKSGGTYYGPRYRVRYPRCCRQLFPRSCVGGSTIRFQVLNVFLVLAHDRRRIVHFNVTAHPTAEWTAQQLREAFPFEQISRYLLRDRDRIFGGEFRKDVKAMGIKEVLSAPRSPWQRAYVERVIGTIRRVPRSRDRS